MFLAFGPVFDFGTPPLVPSSFEPSCHIFCGRRVIDVRDDKPKYMGHKGLSPLWEDRWKARISLSGGRKNNDL